MSLIKLGILTHDPNSFGSYAKVAKHLSRILHRNLDYDVSYCAKPYLWMHGSSYQEKSDNAGVEPHKDFSLYDGYTQEARLNYVKSVRPAVLVNLGDSWVFARKSSELYRTCLANNTRLICYSPIHSVPIPSKLVDAAKNKCDFQLTMTEYGRTALLDEGVARERTDYVYHGVDTSLYKERDKTACRSYFGVETKGPVIGYVGMNYDYRKMLPLAMIVFSRIQSRYPEAQLFLGTAPTGYWDLNSWKRNLRLRNVFFAKSFYRPGNFGFTEEEQSMFYSSMDCYIHTSTAEGFGLPVLEAMASGVPVVCTDLPTFREVFGGVPYYARSNKVIPTVSGSFEYLVDVDDMASKILRILDAKNFEEVRYRAQKGVERASTYSWERAAAKLHSITCIS